MSPRPKLRTGPGAGVVVRIVYQPSSCTIPKGPWSSRSAGAGGSALEVSIPPSSDSPAPARTKPRRLITKRRGLEGRPQADAYLSSWREAFDVGDRPLTQYARRAVVGVAVDEEA